MAEVRNSIAKQANDEHKVFETVEEQILHRPGQWIGSKRTQEINQYILDGEQFIFKETESNQALSKLIEEVVVNAADEHVRTKTEPKKRGWILDKIDVTINKNGLISIHDNGGIDTGLHSTGARIPEVIFGSLFSSSNYDDTKDRKTVGTNGVGGSLANLFSSSFTVETADAKNALSVTWTNNKYDKSEAILTKTTQHYTKIDYQLELYRFGLTEIPFGIVKYVERLCAVLAASNPGLQVSCNGKVFKFKNFMEFVKLFGDAVLIEENDKKWEVVLAPTLGMSEPRIFGVVNGAECHKGSHIKMATKIINRVIVAEIEKKKLPSLSSNKLSSSYHMYVKIEVDKPEYSAQNKDELASDLFEMREGRKRSYSLTSVFEKKIIDSTIFKYIEQLGVAENAALNSSELKKAVKEMNKKKPRSIEKLIDATESSLTTRRKECELWIFEGASAGSSFRPNRLPRTQGAYLLKGKMKNTTKMSTIQITKNAEIADIMVAVGLDPRNPSDLSGLRYNKIVFCTDMDYDGFSIFAQGYSMFATHFPKLVEEGYIYRAITPLWKAEKKKSETQYFFSNEDYNTFMKKAKGYETTYFKGLGSLEKADYKMILREKTILEQITLSDEALNRIDIFMRKEGENKQELKRILRAS